MTDQPDATSTPVLPGAEPQSWPGGPDGALVIHGFTGSPQSMRGLAQAFADAGFTTELPLLPGHGTSIEDMLPTTWDDWSATAEAAYQDLAMRCDRVIVVGLSMGGTLATWLAANHPEIAGLVAINAAVMPQPEIAELLGPLLEAGEAVFDGIGNDVAKEGVVELAYPQTPLAALASLGAAIEELQPLLASVECPTLVMSSPEDHVVPPASSDHLASSVAGPVERITLARSYHVATIDHDADLIAREAVAFARASCAAAAAD
jgi:carboxylesterase